MVRKGLNRRGISDVVVTVLLILLVVAAVAIIWGFISTFLKSTDTVDTNTLNTGLSIQPQSVKVNWNGTLSFNAKMDLGESVSRVQITLYDSSGNTKMIYRNVSFQKLEVKSFYIDGGEHGLGNITKIVIVPVIETQTGLQVGTMEGEYNINQLDVSSDRCGDGKINSSAGEQCDNGINNGKIILREGVSYSGSTTYCTNATSNLPSLTECKLVSVTGPRCGDNIIDSPIETCDTNNITSTCQGLGYYGGGITCNSCQINSSKCYLPINGLLAYYNLDEGTGTSLADSSGNGKNTVLTLPYTSYDAWTTPSCKRGRCVSFGDGYSSAYPLLRKGGQMQVPSLTNIRSISLWVYIPSTLNKQSNRLLISSPAQCTSNVGTDCFRIQDVGNPPTVGALFTVNGPLTDGGGKYNKIYINGTDYSSVATWDKIQKDKWVHLYLEMPSTYTSNIAIGAQNWGNAQSTPDWNFGGNVDEVSIYNRALADQEIKQIFASA